MEAKYRIEVSPVGEDSRGNALKNKLSSIVRNLDKVIITDNYLLSTDIGVDSVKKLANMLTQTVIQKYSINDAFIPTDFTFAVEVGFLPGVTDNVSHTVAEVLSDMLPDRVNDGVFTTRSFFLKGNISKEDALKIANELYNPLIEHGTVYSKEEYIENGGFPLIIPTVELHDELQLSEVNLDLNDEELINLGKNGIEDADGMRRGPLALDLESMHVIKKYFEEREKRKPKDIELESIAQTWSEHCKHTIFAAQIDDDPKGFFKSYIQSATETICRKKGNEDICLSVFKDNAGGIEFDENFIIADKVETHNSPSALDPFGGSITGIVGVNRDEMGFGMGAKPIANRYGFCFADPEDTRPIYKAKDPSTKLLPPRRIMEGVIHGVEVGGNCSGIPTPQGFVRFNERYKAKPLVFVGTVGLIPKEVNGKSSVKKRAMPGDLVIMVGGRVGRDGIHGATFSSEALSEGSPAAAVQIGDPITQKKMSDALIKEARDLDLYNSITDNGAGGLSCSVAEMAQEAGGFVVNLEKIPVKYPGLAPWQIWVSESQERMTLSVPPEKADKFIALMKKRGVEATVIGEFNDTDRGIVKYNDEIIFNLNMDFLHDGLPKKKFETVFNIEKKGFPEYEVPSLEESIPDMLARLNIASFDFISNQYDFEVQGNSVLKPVQGPGHVNSSVSVIRPVFNSKKGVVLSQGLYPEYSEKDPYRMALSSIDTAVRNAVSAGVNFKKIALLDNFCWCDSTNPERLGQLKETAQACYDLAVKYETPYVSGKDSMFNDFKGFDENFNPVEISVPPTLLISSIGVVDNVENCQSIDFKFENDLIYIIGVTKKELNASEYFEYLSEKYSNVIEGGEVPGVDTEKNISLYSKFYGALEKNIISSSISIERGGLLTAVMKSSLAGLKGFELNLADVKSEDIQSDDVMLFSESQGRILVTVPSASKDEFEKYFKDNDISMVGTVSGNENIVINGIHGSEVYKSTVTSMMNSYRERFKNYQ